MKLLVKIAFLLIFPLSVMAQPIEMADTFRSEGKIYVVLAVLSILLSVLFFVLFRLDAKLKKLEKESIQKS